MDSQTMSPSRTDEWTRRGQEAVPRGVSSVTPVVVDRAHGGEIWDVDGRRYIDFAGGIAAMNVGHTPERVVAAIRDQAAKLAHACFAVSRYPPYIELAERLAAIAPGNFPKKTLFLNGGAEAVESAVKIARVATGRSAIVTFGSAFHGRRPLTMTSDAYYAEFPYRYRCPCGGNVETCDIETGQQLERMFATTLSPQHVAAIVVEPVQGEGGVVVAPFGWLRTLRLICDREGILLIADEVQTGFGRTGTMFAMEQAGVVPDLMVLAKSLAAGMPLSAVVGRDDIMDAPGPGMLGSTFAGNPVACAAALAVLDTFEEEDLLARARRLGETIAARLDALAETYPLVGEARGLGPMRAVELVTDRATKQPARAETAAVLSACHRAGLIVLKAGPYQNVVRILAPLVISVDLLEEGLQMLESAVAEQRTGAW
jgi:4-aminobutyrate aminotransferase/(S)-3-amino-2-methylpropionate transaminase